MSFIRTLFGNGDSAPGKGQPEVEQLLAQSRQQAAEIISAATEQADRILKETKLFTKSVFQDLEKTLQQSARRAAQQTDAHLSQIVHAFDQHLANVAEQFEGAAVEQLSHIHQELKAAINSNLKHLTNVAQEQERELHSQLADVKRRKTHQLEAQLAEQLPGIVKDAVGHAIPLAEHDKLVREALQRAKDSGLWRHN
jgi:cell division septum initiation protein DivIVA